MEPMNPQHTKMKSGTRCHNYANISLSFAEIKYDVV